MSDEGVAGGPATPGNRQPTTPEHRLLLVPEGRRGRSYAWRCQCGARLAPTATPPEVVDDLFRWHCEDPVLPELTPEQYTALFDSLFAEVPDVPPVVE